MINRNLSIFKKILIAFFYSSFVSKAIVCGTDVGGPVQMVKESAPKHSRYVGGPVRAWVRTHRRTVVPRSKSKSTWVSLPFPPSAVCQKYYCALRFFAFRIACRTTCSARVSFAHGRACASRHYKSAYQHARDDRDGRAYVFLGNAGTE